MIIVYVILALGLGFVGVKWLHNETPPQHQIECTQKGEKTPDCKCEELEATKVTVKP